MKVVLYFIIYYLFLFYYASNLHIGDFEIDVLSTNSFLATFENYVLSIFGRSDFVLRLPTILLSIVSLFLYYKISQRYLKKEKDIYFSLIVFSLMPGFILATLLFNKSIYIIFLLLLFLYTFFYYRSFSYLLLLFYTMVDYSFISLYLGLIFYSIYKKDNRLLIYSLFLLMINANYFNYEIKGHPRGHFADILGIYFAIFSPLVFLYFLYSLLKMIKTPSILWFVSSWGLLFSILLSFRQKIKIDDFAPFVIIAVVFMIATFFKDYRIRLKIFRTPYKILFVTLLGSLILFDIFLLLSPYLFDFKLTSQFRYSKEISTHLLRKGFNYLYCNNRRLCKKLYFYGVKKGKNYYLFFDKNSKKVSISHNNRKIYSFYVSNLNKTDKK